jgi:hypothetical protein
MNSTDASAVDRVLPSSDTENLYDQGFSRGPISHKLQSKLFPFSYPSIPSGIRNQNYPSFVGSALDLGHLKDGLIRELCRCTATAYFVHFQVRNRPQANS